MITDKLNVSPQQIKAFCLKWKVTEFAFFGSVLRDDFRADSDVDVMISFAKDAPWSLFEMVDMEDELKSIFGRSVDLVTRRAIEQSPNWIRRQAILESTEVVYAQ